MLKPCPNPECKHTRPPAAVDWVPTLWQVVCNSCALSGPTAHTKAEAERLWNLLPCITDEQKPVEVCHA